MTNCCDDFGNCNQGRECPVRKERIEQVAKVGKQMHGPEPLPPSIWRHQLRRFAFWLLLAVAAMMVWPMLAYLALR